ncbi:hypothetical protein [Streptomyces sp. G1]|uniref:hypothetical protein n=1 Tax=Streptomyces sp. G1 TaxID=361572 RepID=UPI0020306F73|nr:hypothetical protein [Streptomyces sp. G1]MCM1967775.1 hypothetical protein [Streptomyces sp. G1]
MNSPTLEESYDHILGASPDTWPWWDLASNVQGLSVPDGWVVEGTIENPYDDNPAHLPVRLGHVEVVRAIRRIASGKGGKHVSPSAQKSCSDFLFRREEADFDAGTADEVLQVAVFGDVVYG